MQLADPSTGQIAFEIEEADAAAARAALDRARDASGDWAARPALARAAALDAAARAIEAEAEELARLIVGDVGKPLTEARGEVARTARILRFAAGLAERPAGALYEDAAGGHVRVVRRPRGTVVLICPWNFPLAIPAWKLAPALLAGNAVVLKPAPPATRLAQRLADALHAAGVPEPALAVVPGDAAPAQALLDAGPDAVSFTGSTAVGREIGARLATALIPCQLELGGKNAVFVSAAADPAEAARIVLAGAMGYAGQKCTASSVVHVASPAHEPLLAQLREQVAALPIGHPLDETVVAGPLIDVAARDRAAGEVEAAAARGVEVVCGGAPLPFEGAYMEPALVQGGDGADDVYTRELFAPILAVLPVEDVDASLDLLDRLEQGLVAGIVSPLRAEIERFVRGAEVGIVRVNAPTPGVEPHVPFGGLKASSFGPREQGEAGLAFFSETRTIYG